MAGGSSSASTVWISDTALLSGLSYGVGGSIVLAVTSGISVGSQSLSLSFDESWVSSLTTVNDGLAGGESVTVVGMNLGQGR